MAKRKKKIEKLYFTTAEVAAMLGYSTKVARSWVQRDGIARKMGGRWFVTKAALMQAYPELFQ